MKRVRPDILACQLQPPRNPRLSQQCRYLLDTRPIQHTQRRAIRLLSHHHEPSTSSNSKGSTVDKKRWTSTASPEQSQTDHDALQQQQIPRSSRASLRQASTTQHAASAGVSIARLSALHARLSLPPKLTLNTLARCLIDASADANPARNNASLALLGRDLLANYTSEHLIVNFPRIPVPILFAAQYAYSGPATLAALRAEWGVELAAAPGIEVNRALLQFKRFTPGNALAQDGISQVKDLPSNRRLNISALQRETQMRRGMSKRIAVDDEFGDVRPDVKPYPGAITATRNTTANMEEPQQEDTGVEVSPRRTPPGEVEPVTTETASATFVRALAGAISLHSGDDAVKKFHKDHILSRHLELHKLFDFKVPTFDLSRLCAREDFEPPIARLLSETGRLSRSPVYVVGVFSGEDKLGEGAGASLNEARVRAAAAALRAWYLYSPPQDRIMRPSDMEDQGDSRKTWIPQMVDPGEIVA